MTLAHTRCAQHLDREAAARCPGCERLYCRECVTEHEDRLVCARCLARTITEAVAPPSIASVRLLIQSAIGFLLLWGTVLALGRVLLALPSELHEGTLWAPAALVDE